MKLILQNFKKYVLLACGKNKDLDNSMIIGGRVAKKGAYPWHAAIYDIKTSILICGATLIHLRVVLTGILFNQSFKY